MPGQSKVRVCLWIAGGISLGVAWATPLTTMAGSSFFIHMTLHMLVVAIAAPLLSLGIAGSSFDPVRYVPAIFAAIPASVGELLIVWAWHLPALHHAARHTALGLIVEQLSFLIVGLWIWLSAFGGPSPRNRGRSGAGVIALLLTSMHMTLLGALLALAPRPLFQHHRGLGSLSALEDQHLGGAVMLAVGGIVYLSGGLWLTVDLLRRPEAVDLTRTGLEP